LATAQYGGQHKSDRLFYGWSLLYALFFYVRAIDKILTSFPLRENFKNLDSRTARFWLFSFGQNRQKPSVFNAFRPLVIIISCFSILLTIPVAFNVQRLHIQITGVVSAMGNDLCDSSGTRFCQASA
jgi:hypothetical protein